MYNLVHSILPQKERKAVRDDSGKGIKQIIPWGEIPSWLYMTNFLGLTAGIHSFVTSRLKYYKTLLFPLLLMLVSSLQLLQKMVGSLPFKINLQDMVAFVLHVFHQLPAYQYLGSQKQ